MAAISMDGIPITALPADAENINYDNSNSGLTATQVQAAVDEVSTNVASVQNESKLNTQDLTTLSRTKNILPMTLSKIKALNTTGTWSGNSYTYQNTVYTINTDSNDNVVSISVVGTPSGDNYLSLLDGNTPSGNYILNGAPSGGGNTTYYLGIIADNSGTTIKDIGQGTTIVSVTSSAFVIIQVKTRQYFEATFYPMLRKSTDDSTFAPYIPSINNKVNKNIEDISQLRNTLTDLFITGHTTLAWNDYEGRLTKEILGVTDCKCYIWNLHCRAWENIIFTSFIGETYIGIRAWEKTTPNAEQISLKRTGSLEIYWEGIYLGKSIEFP